MVEKSISKLITLLGLSTLLMCNIYPAVAEGQPRWAREGIYLTYSWDLYEYVPLEEVDRTIEMMRERIRLVIEMLSSRPMFGLTFNLSSFDSEKGYFRFIIPLYPQGRQEAIAEYHWETGYLRVGNNTPQFFPLYKSPSNLVGLPIVEVKTPMGTFLAYEERVQNASYKFHKDTGVLLEVIKLSGPLRCLEGGNTFCWDVMVMWLIDTNIPRARPSITVQEEIEYQGESLKVVIETSSNVSDFGFDHVLREISFTVSGRSGEPGFCNVSLPKKLIDKVSEIQVYFDDQPINFELSENLTHYAIYFEYVHSDHKVVIRFPSLTSETVAPAASPLAFPVQALTIAVVIATVVALGFFILMKRVKQKQTKG